MENRIFCTLSLYWICFNQCITRVGVILQYNQYHIVHLLKNCGLVLKAKHLYYRISSYKKMTGFKFKFNLRNA